MTRLIHFHVSSSTDNGPFVVSSPLGFWSRVFQVLQLMSFVIEFSHESKPYKKEEKKEHKMTSNETWGQISIFIAMLYY